MKNETKLNNSNWIVKKTMERRKNVTLYENS